METLYEEHRNGFDIEITYDIYSDSPTEWGNFTIHELRETDQATLDELSAKLKSGKAFMIDKYEHSGVVYRLAGTDGDRWDTFFNWGYIEFDDEYVKDISFEDRKEYARGDLETYTQWANGEVYSVNISEDGEMIDGCGGNIGDLDDIIKEARDTVDRLTPKRDATRAPRATSLHI